MVTIVKISFVAVILISMILVLMLIGHLTHPQDSATNEERDRLLRDVETRDRVITSNSLFHQFLARIPAKGHRR